MGRLLFCASCRTLCPSVPVAQPDTGARSAREADVRLPGLHPAVATRPHHTFPRKEDAGEAWRCWTRVFPLLHLSSEACKGDQDRDVATLDLPQVCPVPQGLCTGHALPFSGILTSHLPGLGLNVPSERPSVPPCLKEVSPPGLLTARGTVIVPVPSLRTPILPTRTGTRVSQHNVCRIHV